MKKIYFLSLAVGIALLSSNAFSADSGKIGTSLALKLNSSSTPSIGASYTTANDSDSSRYLFNFSSSSLKSETLRYNFYLKSSDSYLMDWSATRTTELTISQIMISDAAVIAKILAGQKMMDGNPELYFVMANADNLPIYNISISDMCAKYPNKFHNLTDARSCDQF